MPKVVSENSHIILFDGVCNLCTGWVSFVYKRDIAGRFKFVSVQSETGLYGLATITLIFLILMMTSFASWFSYPLMAFKKMDWDKPSNLADRYHKSITRV